MRVRATGTFLRTVLMWAVCITMSRLVGLSSPLPYQAAKGGGFGFRWHHDFTDAEMMEEASLVIVARVDKIDAVGETINAVDDKGHRADWQLLKVTATVENALRGAALPPTISFYFYLSSGPLMGDWNSLHLGSRYLFFLVSEGGVLRAVRDFWRSSIEVGSGRHRSLPATTEETLRQRVAALLLFPGEDVDALAYRRLLPRSIAVAGQLIGLCGTIESLKIISRDRTDELGGAVASQLAVLPQPKGCAHE